MQKRIFLLPTIVLIATYYLPSTSYHLVHAASPTPTATSSALPSPADQDTINENVKKRLQDSLKTVSPAPAVSAKSYVGKVKDVIGETLIIEDKDGKRDIKLSDDATILRSPGNASIKADSIRLGDYVIAIGYPGEGEVLLGHRLIVSAEPIKPPAKSSGLGTIAKINKSSLTLQVGDQEKVIDITSKTIFKSPAAIIELSDLAVGDKLIYTAKLADDNGETATLIMRIQTAAIPE